MSDFSRAIPAMTATVSEWLNANDLRPVGEPFLRYHVIKMPDRMDVELGIPCDDVPETSDQVTNSVLPAGRYAVLKYQGIKNGVSANKELIEWIAQQNEHIASQRTEHGDAFDGRYETFLTDETTDPDQDNWETEVAIKLRD